MNYKQLEYYGLCVLVDHENEKPNEFVFFISLTSPTKKERWKLSRIIVNYRAHECMQM